MRNLNRRSFCCAYADLFIFDPCLKRGRFNVGLVMCEKRNGENSGNIKWQEIIIEK